MRHADRNIGFERDRETVFEMGKIIFSSCLPALQWRGGSDVNVNSGFDREEESRNIDLLGLENGLADKTEVFLGYI